MKIGITCPLYVTCPEHVVGVGHAFASLKSAEHGLALYPVVNRLVLDYAERVFGDITGTGLPVDFVQARTPQAVARAWNDGLTRAIGDGCDYVLVINDDIVLKSNAIDRLVAFARSRPEAAIWSMSQHADLATLEAAGEDESYAEHPNFSAFLVGKDFFGRAGYFDENFGPAYFEDNDMHARLALNGIPAYVYGGARFWHHCSLTINADPSCKRTLLPFFERNRAYFIAKWGTEPVGEASEMRRRYYRTPFDRPVPLSYWEKHDAI